MNLLIGPHLIVSGSRPSLWGCHPKRVTGTRIKVHTVQVDLAQGTTLRGERHRMEAVHSPLTSPTGMAQSLNADARVVHFCSAPCPKVPPPLTAPLPDGKPAH